MKKCIIFGAGFYGRNSYVKLSKYYDVIHYADNNEKLYGQYLNGISIISFDEAVSLYSEEKIDIFICCRAFMSIFNDFLSRGIKECYVMIEGFLYHIGTDMFLHPYSLSKMNYYKKSSDAEKNILFVQNTACIRTHKIASVMRKKGYKIFLLYTMAPPEYSNPEFKNVYEDIYYVFTEKEVIDFVNNSEFDLLHSSNEPDILTNLLIQTNKKVVYDCHDTLSLKGYNSIENLTLEYIANTQSDGVIYTSKYIAELAKNRYNLDIPVFYLENTILEQIAITSRYSKLSAEDGSIHCVYEGAMVETDKSNARYFEDIWKKITDCGIHIHFYTHADEIYCRELDKKSPYLHYEGNVGSKVLANEMTKYDCGLALFNVNEKNRIHLETGTANKIYEYLNSGIPVIVGNIDSYIKFVEKYGIGRYLDTNNDIKKQINEICKIKIPENFLNDNNMTMESKGDELEKFYQKIMTGK